MKISDNYVDGVMDAEAIAMRLGKIYRTQYDDSLTAWLYAKDEETVWVKLRIAEEIQSDDFVYAIGVDFTIRGGRDTLEIEIDEPHEVLQIRFDNRLANREEIEYMLVEMAQDTNFAEYHYYGAQVPTMQFEDLDSSYDDYIYGTDNDDKELARFLYEIVYAKGREIVDKGYYIVDELTEAGFR